MKFTCLQENLAKGLGIVYRAIPTKSSLPILSNVLISAENGQIKLAATNTETTITTYIGASIDKEGSITVPAKLLRDFVSTLSPNTLTAELKDLTLHMVSDKTKSRFNGVDASDYPNLPEFNKDLAYMELDPKIFSHAVSLVAFAAAADESRPIFTGVYLNLQSGTLTIASSDGFRLSEKVMNLDTAGDMDDFTVIVPAKTLLEISRIFSASDEPLKMAIHPDANMVLFKAEDTTVSSNILNGEYPNYKRIIPEEHILQADFDSSELAEAVKLTNLFSTESVVAVKLRFNPEGYINIGITGEETGAHESQVSANIDGEETEIAFNSKYLLDFLTNTKSNRISFKAKSASAPCLFIPLDHENYMHVIAPMQIQG